MDNIKSKEFYVASAIWCIIVAIVSYHTLPVLSILSIVPLLFYFFHLAQKEKIDLNPQLKEEVKTYQEACDLLEGKLQETLKMLDDYEEIFDSQLVNIPCVCGDNMFTGILSPNIDNEVRCDKCNNLFSIKINYDTVLISEPMVDTTVVTNQIARVEPIIPIDNG